MSQKKMESLRIFQEYCWTCYAPGSIDGDIFANNLTREEMDAACLLRSKNRKFEGDSFDREHARDLIMIARGEGA